MQPHPPRPARRRQIPRARLGPRQLQGELPLQPQPSAIALTVALSAFYPQATLTFWALALACAALRYLLDAHWPSDVVAGIALGYGLANGVLWLFRLRTTRSELRILHLAIPILHFAFPRPYFEMPSCR